MATARPLPEYAAPCAATAQGVAVLQPVGLRAAAWSPAAAFYLQASITMSFLAGSSAPTPLYRLYQAAWGFSPTILTLVFGIYALAVLLALLVVGRLSDYVGRRPVLLVAIAAQIASMFVFATAHSVAALLLARVIQGLATGAAVAAVGAGLLDLDRARGTVANSVAPMMGTALGAVLAGFMVRYLPAPTQLVYTLLGAVFVVQGLGVYSMAETTSTRPGALASLRPQFGLPRAVRAPLLRAVPVLVATWALAGFYASLGPTLLRGLADSDSSLLGGLALFVLAGSGALGVLALRQRGPREMVLAGAGALMGGVACILAALSAHSVFWFFVGTALAGAGFGPGFQGAVRAVIPLAGARDRAGVLAVIFVVSYLAMGLPAVLAGWLVARNGSIVVTAQGFGAAVIALAALAMAGSWRAGHARRGHDEAQRGTALGAGPGASSASVVRVH
jgi:predicted MFS family arabinose efflux permease